LGRGRGTIKSVWFGDISIVIKERERERERKGLMTLKRRSSTSRGSYSLKDENELFSGDKTGVKMLISGD
jgi:hypothetical protein